LISRFALIVDPSRSLDIGLYDTSSPEGADREDQSEMQMDDAQQSPAVEAVWAACVAALGLPADARYFEAFRFGSTPDSADELAALVLDGTKTATSSSLRSWEAEGRRPPQGGDYSIVLDAGGAPVCVVQTVEAPVRPFESVDAQFAHDYGEGERTLDWWRREMWDYYLDECATHGWQPACDMPIIFERLRVVYPLANTGERG